MRNFKKLVRRTLTHLVMLGAIILLVFAFATPTERLPQLALIQVIPKFGHDGPSIWMGVLGSCSRRKNDETPNCTKPTIPPQYDFSVLSRAHVHTISLTAAAPSRAMASILAGSLGLSIVCWVPASLWALFAPRFFKKYLKHLNVQHALLYVGIFSVVCSGGYFLLLVLINRIVSIFNEYEGIQYTNLVAKIGVLLPRFVLTSFLMSLGGFVSAVYY